MVDKTVVISMWFDEEPHGTDDYIRRLVERAVDDYFLDEGLLGTLVGFSVKVDTKTPEG